MAKMTDEYRRDTRLVRAGLERSRFQETSEAMFLNSGYVYDSAEEAAAAFAGEVDRFVYSRYGNPTVSMLQTRLAALEGAEACLATGTGHGRGLRRACLSARQGRPGGG
jgi:O-succinylhomoserine sulfhydrylase